MQFHKYLDIIYLNKNFEIQKEFSLKTQAQTRAIPDLVNWQRSFYKLIAYFTLVYGYLKAELLCKYPTLCPELQKLKDDQDAKKDTKKLEVVKDVEKAPEVIPPA